MDNFKVIYKILKKLEESMDCERFDMGTINHEAMEISKTRWNRIIKMMIDNNLISGVQFISADDDIFCELINYDIHITLQGLHYLEENSAMSKIHKTLKNIKEATPMI